MRLKRFLAGLILLAGFCVGIVTFAETELYAEDPFAETAEINWKDLGQKKAQKLAVYSAPFAEAWRGAKGKAALSTKEKFTLLGSLQEGTWGMVEYRVNKKNCRVGWIQLPEEGAALTRHQDLSFRRKPFRTVFAVSMTDDPNGGRREIRKLAAGETVVGMCVYHAESRDWIYAETEIQGKTAWGFLPAEALEEGEPLIHQEGDTLVIHEGVTVLGGLHEYQQLSEEEDAWVMVIEPGDIELQGLLYFESGGTETDAYNEGIRRLSLPGSLRAFGSEALVSGVLEELRIDGSVTQMSRDALYAVSLGRITLAQDYTGEIPDGEYVRVGEWKIEAGNPRYSDRDGVLFSADGKTLIRYPNMRTETHYDVPAGTEAIADGAFDSDGMDIALQSVSLPIGLKRIGKRAFSGCGLLRSLTVPLTVTEVDETAFRNCVSLERLSLPPGMTASVGEWVQKTDFTWFNGDNGSTMAAPAEKEPWEEDYASYPVLLDNEAGSGSVPLYAGPDSAEVIGEMPAGAAAWVYRIENGRADVSGSEEEPRWAALENLQNQPGDLFFTITGAEMTNAAQDGRKLFFRFLNAEGAVFGDWSDNFYQVTVPYEDVRLIRVDGPREETVGIIRAEDPAVRLQKEPEGEPIAHLYFETQAWVTEQREGWLRIETGLGEGWIPENSLIPVYPEG